MGIRNVGTGEVTTSCVVFCLILLQVCPVPVSGMTGEEFLKEKEEHVAMIVEQAIRNYNQQCDLIKTCASNCTRSSCAPNAIGDADRWTCMNVTNNGYCGAKSGEPCSGMYFDYSSSYVRIPATANDKSHDTQLTICAQRELDGLMKKFSNSSGPLTRVYFASVDGIWRTFPGSAQRSDLCRTFDPRVRPWYRDATSVKKVVVILIDIGASMSSNLSPASGRSGTILGAAQDIVAEFLRTLSVQDYVNIIVFNSTSAIALRTSTGPVLVQSESNNGTIDLELQSLLTDLKKHSAGGQSRQSDLNAAIMTGLTSFEADSQAAKVMVVITDGKFATGNVTTSLPTADLLRTGVKTFIYKLPASGEDLINQTELMTQLKQVGGHFEPIEKNLENPLLALRSFFNYTANLNRALRNDRPQYSIIYREFDNLGGNISTVSRTAFGPDGELIGVAGITLYMDWLGNLKDQVLGLLDNKTKGYSPSPKISLSEANFTSKSKVPCPGLDSAIYQNQVVCNQTDRPSSIESHTCCELCTSASAPRAGAGHAIKIGSGVAAAVVLGLVVGLLILLRNRPCVRRLTGTCRRSSSEQGATVIPEFPGPAHAAPVPLKQ